MNVKTKRLFAGLMAILMLAVLITGCGSEAAPASGSTAVLAGDVSTASVSTGAEASGTTAPTAESQTAESSQPARESQTTAAEPTQAAAPSTTTELPAAPSATKPAAASTSKTPVHTTKPEAAKPSAETTVPKPEVELLVSAAASLTDVASELAARYKAIAPNVKITYTFGSSGALQTQIEEGAPSDIFMSAAKKQMTTLEEKGLISEGTKKDLLVNKVVLIKPKDSGIDIKTFDDVASDKILSIALGEPTSVPVGQYSEEIFTYLGILDKVKIKANYGSDVRQVLTWVESGEIDCGVVYSTDAMTSDKITIVCEAPAGSHKPVIYPVAVVKSSKHQAEAKSFLDYLSTPEAAAIFKKYGFSMN